MAIEFGRLLNRIGMVSLGGLLFCLGLSGCDGGDECSEFATYFCYEDSASDPCGSSVDAERENCYLTHADGLCNYFSVIVNPIAIDACYADTSERTCDRFDNGFEVPDSCHAAFVPTL